MGSAPNIQGVYDAYSSRGLGYSGSAWFNGGFTYANSFDVPNGEQLMPLPRYPEVIMKGIWDKYCPMVAGPKRKDGTDGAPVQDPSVLYVGPLLDGLCVYAPQIVGRATWPSEGGIEDRRRRLKHLLSSVGSDGRAANWNARNARLTIAREGKGPVTLGDRIITSEPGELVNSYEAVVDPETGEVVYWEFLHKRDEALATSHMGERRARVFVPVIREDKRYGLHYLRRGDTATFEYVHRKAGPIRMEFSFRPLSEGDSLLTSAQAAKQPTW